MFVSVVCSNSYIKFSDLLIGELFSPSSRIGMRTRTHPQWHTTPLRHRVVTRSPSQLPAQDQPSPSVRRPHLFLNRLFYRAIVNVFCLAQNVVDSVVTLCGARGSRFHLNRSSYEANVVRNVRSRSDLLHQVYFRDLAIPPTL